MDVDLVIVDLGATREDLQPNRVPCFETPRRHAFGCLPAGRPTVMRRDVRRRVQSQPRDDGVSVSVARVNRDPFAASAFAEISEFR